MSKDSASKMEDTVVAIPLQSKDENRKEKMLWHFELNRKDGENKMKHRWKLLNVNGAYAKYRQKNFTTMLEKHSCKVLLSSTSVIHIGRVGVAKHCIDLVLGEVRTIHAHPHNAGLRRRDLEKFEMESIVKYGISETVASEWASPRVFTRNENGKLRFCVRHRCLNAMTIRDGYPIP